jgi:Tol biopolymer transport system component/serine/threonine protein kinase
VSEVRSRQGVFRFEKFELDLRAGELRPDEGTAVRLSEQPFQILVMLLEHPGEVVTRDELRKRLWPNDTIVEFEHSISAAMNRLRQALGESADSPHCIETLARRGYRWMVPVEWKEQKAAGLAALALPEAAGESLSGKRVSHYRVLQILGGGGMGIVYKAEDIKLGRQVALKFLPEELATDSIALHRFEREAHAASALDHPNICTIYEFGEHEGKPFIVMQLLEGQTVREHVAAADSGHMLWPIEKLVDLVVQVAEGLDAAHRQGIVHRDIKPANIFITKRGEAKILDFGVAKFSSVTEPLDNATITESDSPAPPALGLTVTGKTMGTASYMSPEQVRGEKLDARTDLFSFGLVFYEMATTQRAFPGDTATRVHRAILEQEYPSPRVLNPGLPSHLEGIIHKCLEKDRESRYRTASDLLIDLKQLQRDLTSEQVPLGRKWLVGTVALFLLVVALLAGWWLPRRNSRAVLPPMRIVPLATNSGIEGRPAFSPDGSQVAFMWDGGEEDQYDIYVKLIGDRAPPVRITKSSGTMAGWPVWSPDGHHIAFLRCADTGGAIFVVPALGGLDRRITEFGPCPGELDWSPDGSVLVFANRGFPEGTEGISLVSVDTGKLTRLTTPKKRETDSEAKFSPDGRNVAFVRTHDLIVGDIFVVGLDAREPRRVTHIDGEIAGLAWTTNGEEIIFAATSGDMGNSNNALWRVKAGGGNAERVTELAAVNATEPTISRHGHRLAYRHVTKNANVWQLRLPTRNGRATAPTKFISSTRFQDTPQYSPDGKKIVFSSDRSGSGQIWVCESDASNPVQLTFLPASNTGTPRWSADGRSIVFDSTASGKLGIFTVSIDGGTSRPLIVDSHFNATPSASRDGRWIYFLSDRGGDYQVWKSATDGGEPTQITFHGGTFPMESADGKFLYYVKGGGPLPPNQGHLWRMPVGGSQEELVIPEEITDLYWALAPGGVYFIDTRTRPHATLKYFDATTKRISKIFVIEKNPSCCGQGLAVTPDGHTVLYTQEDSVATDLMLVENFR